MLLTDCYYGTFLTSETTSDVILMDTESEGASAAMSEESEGQRARKTVLLSSQDRLNGFRSGSFGLMRD